MNKNLESLIPLLNKISEFLQRVKNKFALFKNNSYICGL